MVTSVINNGLGVLVRTLVLLHGTALYHGDGMDDMLSLIRLGVAFDIMKLKR
jgi:hypothetical protein